MAELPMHYETRYRWEGKAANGRLAIADHPDLPAGTPHELDRYSPEHLLVASAEICLANYVLLIAGLSKLDVKAYQSSAAGDLEREPKAGYRFKRILIRPEITVQSGAEALAERVLAKAHGACLIARSLNCPVDIEPVVHGE
jgi:organic hydroperoxide reductase OsmC/OhrA